MRFLIHMSTSEEAGSLARMLRLWTWSTCADMETELWSPGASGPAIVIWDLDAGLPPSGMVSSASTALLVCSSRPQAAIDSYSLHPDGFLQKPVRQSALFTALRRCAKLWWDSLERLEILSDRLRVRLPLCDLIWAEGARRGCLVHSSQECIVNCETLSSLEARLPKGLFFRCQRSFLINLTHVRQLDSQGLLMSDGTLIPMNRGSRKPISDAYRLPRPLQHRTGEGAPLKGGLREAPDHILVLRPGALIEGAG